MGIANKIALKKWMKVFMMAQSFGGGINKILEKIIKGNDI